MFHCILPIICSNHTSSQKKQDHMTPKASDCQIRHNNPRMKMMSPMWLSVEYYLLMPICDLLHWSAETSGERAHGLSRLRHNPCQIRSPHLTDFYIHLVHWPPQSMKFIQTSTKRPQLQRGSSRTIENSKCYSCYCAWAYCIFHKENSSVVAMYTYCGELDNP